MRIPFQKGTEEMTSLNRWNPLKEMEEMSNRLNSIWSTPTSGSNGHGHPALPSAESEWSPMVDIIEHEDHYEIKADLPEMNKNDIKVRLESGLLFISGERKIEKSDNTRFHRTERYYGSFMRSFSVPSDTDQEKITAEFKNGVLSVHLKKVKATKPNGIEVKIS